MAKAEKTNTVTLPAPKIGNVYREIPASLEFHIDGAGKVKTDYTFNLSELAENLLGAFIRQGGIRFVGTATTSAKEDESPKEACDRRFAEIVSGEYKPGQGGGARVDTYTVVLRERVVVVAMNNLGLKKGEAVKAARDDAQGTFRLACDKVAEMSKGQDGETTSEALFDLRWPQIEKGARVEADRRDKATGLDFDLGDFAGQADAA